jgi:N-acetylmuramoyl-L-alanine amidase
LKRITVILLSVAGVGLAAYTEHRLTQMQASLDAAASQLNEASSDLKEATKAVRDLEAQVISSKKKLSISAKEQHCLALNVFHEAGVESDTGKIAVAHVTLNRWRTKRWGKDICSVVYAHAQFSWTLNKKKRNEVPEGPLWEASKRVVQQVIDGARVSALNSSLYYHTNYIKTPIWADASHKIMHIGQHIFYSKALTKDDLDARDTTS